MSRFLKLFLMILALGIFILPRQVVMAQPAATACTQQMSDDGCCNTDTQSVCHTDSQDSKKDTCGDHCSDCGYCPTICFFTYLAPSQSSAQNETFALRALNFGYRRSFITSPDHPIWQPPKIA